MATTYEWDQLGAEIMDSRSLIAVAREIQDAIDAAEDEDEPDRSLLEILDVDEDEAREILAEIEEIEDVPTDWIYGATFIREDHFVEYAQQLAEDLGEVSSDHGWPGSYIDWDAAADALKQDYTEVEFRGSTYYVRA